MATKTDLDVRIHLTVRNALVSLRSAQEILNAAGVHSKSTPKELRENWESIKSAAEQANQATAALLYLKGLTDQE